ncbi:Thioredoxin-like protein CITRX, chloroplastic [Seminavis robusta]|uniref:Thioredoxin-like protein CITRX, chloroplastic n=1 Tax=Seminavis robusta TaxID=568900 RepID=A0A9N8DKW2_9STRA|nr:Thioredoxin-like protein CITRX, chloroplastic [Seminavis robusta]|eukprot:Sro211_g087880.1 Thioredoxin-like protein CITRX, chloroplastic (808) ;mRNA; f:30422-32845
MMKSFAVVALRWRCLLIATALLFGLAESSRSRRPWSLPPRIGSLFSSGKSNHGMQLDTIRGGEQAASTAAQPSLDEKVQAAMERLGISKPTTDAKESTKETTSSEEVECEDGVCPVPTPTSEEAEAEAKAEASSSPDATPETKVTPAAAKDPYDLADEMAKELQVPSHLAMAALGATMNGKQINEQAARDMIQFELDLIKDIPTDSPNVQTLTKEGFDEFLSRRALALTGNQMDDARAILIADQMDEQEEREEQQKAKEQAEKERAEKERAEREKQEQEQQPAFKEVKTDFDPTAIPAAQSVPAPAPKPAADQMPKPAAKESVVFEATTAQLQELVLESPVPVILDVYADWCGPCKVLTPALEDMAIKAGGMFRLVKVNTDNERPVSAALEVTALPTVFGISNGKILHMFQGMPRDEKAFQNFLMGLLGAAPFAPPVTVEQSEKYEELTTSLIKTAGAAAFSFSARERLTDHITTKLDALHQNQEVDDVEASATLLRTLFNNVVKNPYEPKFRKVNLNNPRIATSIGASKNALGVLKGVGYTKNEDNEMWLAKGKKVINVAPLVVARDVIDKWVQTNRREMAKAARKRKDEADRAKLELEQDDEEDEEEEEEEEIDPTICNLKLRLDGKKKVHEVTMKESDPLSSILDVLKIDASAEEEVRITCVAKRLVVKSSDADAMAKSLKDHGLMPAAAIVVKVGSSTAPTPGSSSMKDRVAKRKKKKGSHTMQSVGIYSTEDNAKGELVDGGGGVWYEQDVSDDEEDEPAKEEEQADDGKVEEKAKEEPGDEPSKAEDGTNDDEAGETEGES